MFLTKKQKEIFDFVREHIQEHSYAPSIDEIRLFFGLSSPATVHKHLRLLEQKGVLRRAPNQSRGLEIIDKEGAAGDYFGLSLLGTIAAGEPIEAVDLNETISIPEEFFGKENIYVLRVRGNSMIDEQIRDGDYVIVEKKETAENGEMVVALINRSEATLKKYYRQADGVIRLEPANTELKPIFVSEENLQIQGRIIGILRKY